MVIDIFDKNWPHVGSYLELPIICLINKVVDVFDMLMKSIQFAARLTRFETVPTELHISLLN